MKHLERYLIGWLALVLCAMTACAPSQTADTRDSVEEMVTAYGQYGVNAVEVVEKRLQEISAADRTLGKKWKKIMARWDEVNHELTVNEGALPENLPDTDELALVVLGYQLNPDGTMRDELLERLKVARACADQYPHALIVCTGGGTAAHNDAATEAGVMADWLVQEGIGEGRVIVEDHSLTTAQNAAFTYRILSEQYPQVKQLAIISSDYHIATGTLFFDAECILEGGRKPSMQVVSNAAYMAPAGSLSTMFQAGGLLELEGDTETAFEIYYDTYDLHELPDLNQEKE